MLKLEKVLMKLDLIIQQIFTVYLKVLNMEEKIGWVNEDSLSKKIYENIINLENNEYSNVMNLNNNLVILKVEDHRIVKNTVDKKRT